MTNFELDEKSTNYFIICIVLSGIFLRLFFFFSGRSLWLDEVYLSSSLLRMNYYELLTTPLDYQQKAPVCYLLTVKFFVNLFGKNEIGLRFFSLLAGILSPIVFIPVSKYFLKEIGVLLSLIILCFSPALIYHAVEAKQYSVELFCSILSLYLLVKFISLKSWKYIFFWGGAGAILIWFSYAEVFVLSGIGFGLSLYYIYHKQWDKIWKSSITFLMWLISFVLNYMFFIVNNKDRAWVVYWFRFYNNFLPIPPKNVDEIKWFLVTIYRMLDYPLGLLWDFIIVPGEHWYNLALKMPILPIIMMSLGVLYYFRRSKLNFLIILFPILMVFIASILEYYPLTERFWLIITPNLILLIASGLDNFGRDKMITRTKFFIFILLITGPVVQSVLFIFESEKFYMHKKSYQKEVFQKINKNFQEGDAVYVYWNEIPGYRVYRNIENYKFLAIEGQDFRKVSVNEQNYNSNLLEDFKQFGRNKRVWIIFNNKFLANVGDGINEPAWYYLNKKFPGQNLKNELEKIGYLLETKVTSDVTVYLFKLKTKK